MMRFPLELPPVRREPRNIARRYFFGVMGVVAGLAFLIFFFGFLAALEP